MSIALLTASNNASSDTQQADSDKTYIIPARGTWGGGTLTLEYSDDGSTFASAGNTLTADGYITHTPQAGLYWRVTLAGATAGSITATAF